MFIFFAPRTYSRYIICVNTIFLISFLILGLIIGSFLNVVLFRYNTGRTLGGRSKCFSCKRTLHAIDLVPVFSYLAFKGKCRTCKSHISIQYPAVELLTGILFATTYVVYAPLFFINPAYFIYKMLVGLFIMSVLVLIIVYDIRHKIIPDLFAFLFAAVSFAAMFIGVGQYGEVFVYTPSFSHLFAGLILAFPFYFLWLVSRGVWMGLGDAKLALGIGWFLGLGAGATAIIYGFWVGAAVSVVMLLIQKSRMLRKILKLPDLSMKSEIPFAPFLILGLLIVFFFQYNMFSVFESL